MQLSTASLNGFVLSDFGKCKKRFTIPLNVVVRTLKVRPPACRADPGEIFAHSYNKTNCNQSVRTPVIPQGMSDYALDN